jgi:hypothetical protein
LIVNAVPLNTVPLNVKFADPTNEPDALYVTWVVVEVPIGGVGVCHVAAVDDVAVNNWPKVGAVAELILTSVVAVFNNDAVSTFVTPVMVLFVNVSLFPNVPSVPVVEGTVIVAAPLLILDIIGVVSVLFVRVSVPLRLANVSVPLGIVIVPPFETDVITGCVNVLLVNVSVPLRLANVNVPLGNVTVPPFDSELITGNVNVLFVNVSVPLRLANVKVPLGNVTVPPFETELITGNVNVLLVNVSVPLRLAKVKVPLGNVTVPPFEIELITGNVKVLLLNVVVDDGVTIGSRKFEFPDPSVVRICPLFPVVDGKTKIVSEAKLFFAWI